MRSCVTSWAQCTQPKPFPARCALARDDAPRFRLPVCSLLARLAHIYDEHPHIFGGASPPFFQSYMRALYVLRSFAALRFNHWASRCCHCLVLAHESRTNSMPTNPSIHGRCQITSGVTASPRPLRISLLMRTDVTLVSQQSEISRLLINYPSVQMLRLRQSVCPQPCFATTRTQHRGITGNQRSARLSRRKFR